MLNKKQIIFFVFVYLALGAFMCHAIGVPGALLFFIFFGACFFFFGILPRMLGDKGRRCGCEDHCGYSYDYSYRYGAKYHTDHHR